MADDTDSLVEQILRTLDLAGWAAISGDAADAIRQAARSGGREALLTLGISEDDSADLFSQVDADALDFAAKRGAELVGMRIDEDGNLIPNPEARWAITDGTRELLRATVRQAIEQGQSAKQLADAVRDGYAFSEARAETVGRTEIARAVAAGNLAGWKKSGVVKRVRWLLGSEHDEEHDRDECDENAEAGAIELGQAFPSGDESPPAHPNCECALVAETEEDAGAEKLAKAATMSKADAEYTDHARTDKHCGICSMFRAPHACTLVKGEISPAGHCKFWEAEERASA